MDKITTLRVRAGPPLESVVETLEKSSGYVRTPIFHDLSKSELISMIRTTILRQDLHQHHLTSTINSDVIIHLVANVMDLFLDEVESPDGSIFLSGGGARGQAQQPSRPTTSDVF